MARGEGWRGRATAWAVTVAALLLLPLAAMQVSDEVAWGVGDFVLAAALVGGGGLAYELAARTARDRAGRAGFAVALGTAFVLVWLSAAVGGIGSEDDPANLMFGGVLAVGALGAVIARLRPMGIARAMVVAASAQMLVAVVALVGRLGSGPLEILVLNAGFAALWLASAWLFRMAARARRASA